MQSTIFASCQPAVLRIWLTVKITFHRHYWIFLLKTLTPNEDVNLLQNV